MEGDYWLCKIRQIEIKEDRDPMYKVKKIGSLWHLRGAKILFFFFLLCLWRLVEMNRFTLTLALNLLLQALSPNFRGLNHQVSLLSLLHYTLFQNRGYILISEFLIAFSTMPCQMASICRITCIMLPYIAKKVRQNAFYHPTASESMTLLKSTWSTWKVLDMCLLR